MLLAIFYDNNGCIPSRCQKQLQAAFNILIELFEYVGLRTNTTKTKVMTYVPENTRTKLSSVIYNNTQDGLHGCHRGNDILVNCNLCEKSMLMSSLPSRWETQYNIYRSLVIHKDILLKRGGL